MSELLQEAVHDKRQGIMEQLIQSGVYKIKNKHLYEMTLSELEKEYVNIGMANEPSQHTYR
ncbi:Fur-regulated basic protein FbpA [Neobacillus drentensis]|uniref:Fur-regulated basic protein FbpA n=1 Tax=Neobacillus drentensis TaxID=220684 RepID=UPI001F3E881D|nr:Fur-regulated basic protein FbpA [Neobacillus drentensis]ULT59234.1 Fur-regulated basic protein FbpA [Neobacillus drentensis]